MISFVAPLIFVVTITMTKEGYDDYQRRLRDKDINETKYARIDMSKGLITDVTSESLRVGDLIKVRANERAPADLVILYTTEKMGSFFIRTD
jgi:phospholipid-translocating ATPase